MNARFRSTCFAVLVTLSVTGSLFAQPGGGGFPQVRVPQGNPITANKVLLGKALFFEEQLSATRTMACATCHVFKNGGSDPRVVAAESVHPGPDGRYNTADDVRGSMGVIASNASGAYRSTVNFGVGTQVTARRSMTVINAAFVPELFWDGRAGNVFLDPADGQTVLLTGPVALESQAAMPPQNDVEMSHFGETWASVAQRIQGATPLAMATGIPTPLANFIANKSYPDLFQMAFGTTAVTPARIVMAIATYERTLVSDQSPFDSFNQGNRNALSAAQERGLRVFQGPNTGCAQCHGGPLLTDNQFHYTGVRPSGEDIGRQGVTNNLGDRGRMRTPSLRNIALRSHYFHNGEARTLADVVDFYNRGGNFMAPNKDRRIRPLGLNANQRADLVAFLQALSDPRVAAETAPFDRPTLYSQSSRMPNIVGHGTAGSGAIVPEILAIEPPFLGNPSFTLGMRKGLGGALAWIALDVDARPMSVPVGGAAIHLDLSAALTVLSTGNLSGTGAGQGFQSISMPVPHDASLRGVTIGAQWVIADRGAGNQLAATPAASIRIF